MGSMQAYPPNPNPKSNLIFLAITLSASLLILFSILYFLYFLYHSLLIRTSRTSPLDTTTPLAKLQRFTYKELKHATHNFNESNSIGKGGSGTVYRGILKDGKLVAVKLLDPSSFQCEQEFSNELKILGGLKSCPLIVCLLGFCVEKGKRLVVYEYMPNKSLQESLFFDSNNGNNCTNYVGLSWGRRYSIVLDVAKALSFLHLECEPPVIHGDVKPSNVLLDSEMRAKLSDFGLSRLKVEGLEFGVDLFSQDLGKSQDLCGNANVGRGGGGGDIETPLESRNENENDHEVDFALALQASSSSKNSCKVYHNVMGLAISSLNFNFKCGDDSPPSGAGNLKGKELLVNENSGEGEDWNRFVRYDDELTSMEHSKELNLSSSVRNNDDTVKSDEGGKQWGKDWWWKQDGSDELCSKDYVMEWIGSQICPNSAKLDWDEEKGVVREKSSFNDNPTPLSKSQEVTENPVQEPGLECLNGSTKKEDITTWRIRGKKHRKMHEWWKEEKMDELSKKSNKARFEVWSKKRFKAPHFGLGKSFRFKRFCHKNYDRNDQKTELSFRKNWKKKNPPSVGSEMWSGDLFSRELSSTTSMRGTLCYVAPEYSGCGYLMEKADIYSFGVLILVIVSGRRPLHVLSSPMKLEKANLISWARNLAHGGNILELVDERLKEEYDKEQATLCINLALACLQKMPELRPDMGDVVKILKGEMELPSLPFEFSPSPPSRCYSQSRRKQKSAAT